MNESLKTTTQLLEQLHDPEQRTIWFEFDARYRPILTAFASRYGLRTDEAEDVAQQTLTEFVADYRRGRYDRKKGRLRTWVMSIARHRIIDLQRRNGVRRDWRGDSAIADVADDAESTRVWEAEEERAIVERALVELRENSKLDPKTLEAFELVVREGATPRATAEQCGMTVDEVYVAKHRVTKKLRETVQQMRTLYEDGDGLS